MDDQQKNSQKHYFVNYKSDNEYMKEILSIIEELGDGKTVDYLEIKIKEKTELKNPKSFIARLLEAKKLREEYGRIYLKTSEFTTWIIFLSKAYT